jgi:hypothetical protein
MIEIDNDPAFSLGYHTQWHCNRCNQEVPNERHFSDASVLRSTDLVDDAAIRARISTCRLVIIIVSAALVGSLAVGSVDRMPRLYLATPFDDAVMDVIRGLVCVFLFGVGAGIVGMFVDKILTNAIRNRAARKRLRAGLAQLPST